MTHATFVWNELITTDVEAAKRFFASTVGWTFNSVATPSGPYWLAWSGETMVGGIMSRDLVHEASVPSHWFTYLQVDDVDRRAAEVEANGGTLIRAPFDVPELGRVAVVADPSGAVLGIMTPWS